MERYLEAAWLTTADMVRRLGVQGGTIRHYGEILRARGYPFRQGPGGEWLWSPEVAEVARAAYALARAVPGYSFERALDYLEYAGKLTTRRSPSVAEVLELVPARVERAAIRLDEVATRLDEVATRLDEAAASLDSRVSAALLKATEGALRGLQNEVEGLQDAARSVYAGMWGLWMVPSVILLVLSVVLALHAVGWLALPPWLGVVGVVLLPLLGAWIGRSL